MEHLTEYNAPPDDERFHEVDDKQLASIIHELHLIADRGDATEQDCDDLGIAVRAAELMDSGQAVILVARDEDGYYFAAERG